VPDKSHVLISLQPIIDSRPDESLRKCLDVVANDGIGLPFSGKPAFEFHVPLWIEKRCCAITVDAGRVLFITGVQTALLGEILFPVLKHAVHGGLQQIVHCHEIKSEGIDFIDGNFRNTAPAFDVRVHLPSGYLARAMSMQSVPLRAATAAFTLA